MIKNVSKALAVIVVILAVLGFAGHSYVNHVEKEKTVVTLAKHPKKVLFFYRDDCPDCQAIFHQIDWHNAIHGKQRYSGTNQQRIKQIVGD